MPYEHVHIHNSRHIEGLGQAQQNNHEPYNSIPAYQLIHSIASSETYSSFDKNHIKHHIFRKHMCRKLPKAYPASNFTHASSLKALDQCLTRSDPRFQRPIDVLGQCKPPLPDDHLCQMHACCLSLSITIVQFTILSIIADLSSFLFPLNEHTFISTLAKQHPELNIYIPSVPISR